jgi:hypothetical protein
MVHKYKDTEFEAALQAASTYNLHRTTKCERFMTLQRLKPSIQAPQPSGRSFVSFIDSNKTHRPKATILP